MSFDLNPQTLSDALCVIEQLRQREAELEGERDEKLDEIGGLEDRVAELEDSALRVRANIRVHDLLCAHGQDALRGLYRLLPGQRKEGE